MKVENCIVQVTRVVSNHWCYCIEIAPKPNDLELKGYIASPTPSTSDGGGIYTAPKVDPGVMAIATKYQNEYFITGFFKPFNPTKSSRSTDVAVGKLEEGDLRLRSSAGSQIAISDKGKMTFFSNMWARFTMSQAKERLDAFFRKFVFSWWGGSVTAENDTNTRIVLTQGFQNPISTDEAKGTEELSDVAGAAIVGFDAYEYVDKAIIDNYTTPLTIDTRQNTNGPYVLLPYHKDVFTVEKRGHQGDEADTVYSFDTIDRSRGTKLQQRVIPAGLSCEVTRWRVLAPQSKEAGDPLWSTSVNHGETYQIEYSAGETESYFRFLDSTSENQIELGTNDYSLKIGEELRLARDSAESPYEVKFDATGSLVIENNEIRLETVPGEGLLVTVKDGQIKLGTEGTEFGPGLQNVLTPKTILGGIINDTFTGIPFVGSQTVAAQD